ncbi:uncharacterized protein ARB_02550 [Trichophyton benhamiae CBS 112371]|uniref:Uncharacterized protein n=1 Tax=Arthroderma benhamiae (strain ATCC MYA-4681 / CBS 112371) TaxID=663331 RepID=D4B267_ARTBC|nr:uncharacterized protein ARB_02550 [Trichophyton benhamiae CBS 112371]EFE30628.1 hypothetical protein ARB_02550 [Trichophyton benhamiae CBS 112371]
MFYVLGSVDDADETGISMFQRRSQPHDLQHRKTKRRRREDEEKTKNSEAIDITAAAMARHPALEILTEGRVLYKRALKLSLDWAVHRNLWRGQAVYIRSLFEANKHVRNPHDQRVRYTFTLYSLLFFGGGGGGGDGGLTGVGPAARNRETAGEVEASRPLPGANSPRRIQVGEKPACSRAERCVYLYIYIYLCIQECHLLTFAEPQPQHLAKVEN